MSELKKNDEKIAVKMLHGLIISLLLLLSNFLSESADRSTVLAFLDEIELMKNIGYHERLGIQISSCLLFNPLQ